MPAPSNPLVSVVIAARDAERTVELAVASMLRQTVSKVEVVLVDDGSRDGTSDVVERLADPRIVLVRSEVAEGLAGALNRGLEAATARYVARLDADDVAHPLRLERQLARLARGDVAVVGASVLELDAVGRPGAMHPTQSGLAAVRWQGLFSSPLFHSTALFDRSVLPDGWPRYDPAFTQAQDFDLWVRILSVAQIDNVDETLVYWRVHPGQVSNVSRAAQDGFRREIGLRAVEALAPELAPSERELAWRVGAGLEVQPEDVPRAAEAYVELFRRFESVAPQDGLGRARAAAARALLRAAQQAPLDAATLVRRAHAIDPTALSSAVVERTRRRSRARADRSEATRVLRQLSGESLRVAVVSPEPAPYRAPLFDLLACRDDIDLTVVYAGHTIAGRTWSVPLAHRAVFLEGLRVPGADRILHHDYPLTFDVVRALREAAPDVVVVAGWSTFACQVAMAWCRRRGVPYVLQVESHDEGPRAGWRRAVKGVVVPAAVRGAAWVLVTGSLVRHSMLERGADPARMGTFAVTVDTASWARRADERQGRRDALRTSFGLTGDDVAVLSVARLSEEKGLDVLLRAVAAVGDPRLVVVIAGGGPERDVLGRLASELGVRLALTGALDEERLLDAYVAADVFALLSHREPWGVVVNEAAAVGLPLLLSNRVGAAPDLLVDGDNGLLVEAGDVESAAQGLGALVGDLSRRRAMGHRSRELASAWGYEQSLDDFVTAVGRASARNGRRYVSSE